MDVLSVLVVDDEPSLVATISYNLKRAGYQVFEAGEGSLAMDIMAEHRPDLVILDVMLPGLDGFAVCRNIRRRSSVPILMLTARDDEVDKVVGLEIGADDYLTKPFSTRELMARVKALLRRREMLVDELAEVRDEQGPTETDGDLVVDVLSRIVRVRGTVVMLKPREFDLLLFFLRHRSQVFSAASLIRRVWGHGYTVDTGTVPVHIRGIRKKIELDPAVPTRIVTVRGVGYRYEG